ncbi:hypothetical protein [Acanthamoeba castellanii mimivirus]|uniref:Uncharacterized protein R133 n=5 Tax=Mimivirus TaxID=315393 RepID=YR133_MIMIV|nr:hypothetical protein MIMI_gp0151 [Acanthamoeba polyphaga mimivirus]Q5UPL4.1 RecName: Full=Uncharacterized protein R133 [Acanthamoeba polyphaga mimivirus]AEQ60311.1 hypothetical protein [Acanthamoeba castellanii mamavirus]AHA45741.1 hypothetical protein HIRU_S835 [Hirudovirus strain Sangsue]AHJ39919.1 hypothetical protein [Samba virus]ALR83644.1 hypothetical protein [Niemeyer virus]AMZ02581.1 hypothetical protein [Mimivirus Bombay]QTF49036.1 hypothetical protein [Mimivirus reunion]WMV6147
MSKILKQLEKPVLDFISEKYNRKIIPNRYDLDDFIDNYISDKDEFQEIDECELDKYCENLYVQLESEGKIYKVGNKKSYIDIVQKKDYISCSEHQMVKAIKNHKRTDCKIVFRDTEFEVDSSGRYII